MDSLRFQNKNKMNNGGAGPGGGAQNGGGAGAGPEDEGGYRWEGGYEKTWEAIQEDKEGMLDISVQVCFFHTTPRIS